MSKKYLIIKYFLTKGPNRERIYKEPFVTKYQIDNNCQNLDLNMIKDILSKEKISSIQDYRYYDTTKKYLKKINQNSLIPISNNISSKNFITLQIHIKEEILFNKDFDYYESQKTEITKMKNKYSQSSLKTLSSKEIKFLDILFLYANPLVQSLNDGNGEKKQELVDQINYRKEIETIKKICEESQKNIFCNFECCNEEKLINYILNSPSKIIHISCHGEFVAGKINLILEKDCIDDKINIETFKKKIGEKKIKNIDLVFLTACYGEPFGKILIECGVKNVICIHSKTKILDDAVIRFCELFYSMLIKDCLSIKECFNQAKKKFPEISFNKKKLGICKNHEHDNNYENCKIELYSINDFKECSCEYEECNIHINTCPFFKKILKENQKNKFIIIKCEDKKNLYKICCCNSGDGKNKITTPHSEGTKFIFYSQNDVIEEKYNNLFYDKIEGKLHINRECFLNYISKIENSFEVHSNTGLRLKMEYIYSIINDGENFKNGNFILIWGDVKIGKLRFSESLCVFLFERGIIKHFLFYIKFEDILMEDEIFEEIKKYKDEKLKNGKNTDKYLIIIKISSDLDEKMIYFLVERILTNEITNSRDNFYYIILFCSKDDKISEFDKYKNRCKGIHFEPISQDHAKRIIDHYQKEYNNPQNKDEVNEYFNRYYLYPSRIKNFVASSNNLTQDTYYDKKEYEKNYMKNLSQKPIMKIYFLLKLNPQGLSEQQIELIIPNFKKILEDNDKEKFINIDENLYKIAEHHYVNISTKDEDKKYCIEKSLEMYAKILYNYIKNKHWEKTIKSEIKYNFNSYNNNGIWKTFNEDLYNKCFNNSNNNELYKKISKDFLTNINVHEENIHKLISNNFYHIVLIIGENELYKEYLMQIILMLPTIFSDKKEKCSFLINKSIKLCKLLNEQNCFLLYNKNFDKEIERLELFLGSITSQFTFDGIVQEQYRQNLGIEGSAEAYFLNGIETENEDSLSKAIDCYKYISSNLKESEKGEINIFNFSFLDYKSYIETRLSYIYYKQGLLYMNCKKFSEANFAFNNGKERINNKDNFLFMKFDLELIEIEKKNKNYAMIEKLLNEDIKMNPKYQNELNELKIKINKEIEADIVMLNSNPLKKTIVENINNISFIHNSHYYILNKLKNKKLNTSIRIESNVLNENNLNDALNKEGKILIIQSDYFTDNGDIILENDQGETNLMKINKLEEILPEIIKYEIVILYFSNSKRLIKVFQNRPNINFLITIDNISSLNMSENGLQKYKFLLGFLINFIQNLNDFNIKEAFENSKKTLQNLIHYNFDLINLTENKNCIISDIKFFDEQKSKNQKQENKFHPIVDIPKNGIDFDINCSDFNDIIYQIICDFTKDKEKIINIYLKNDKKDFKEGNKEMNIKTLISAEIFKFFSRHHGIFPGGVFYIKTPEKTKSFKLYEITKKKFKEKISSLPILIIINNLWKVIDQANELNINVLDKIQDNISYLIITKSRFPSRKVCNIQIDQNDNEIFLNKYKKALSENSFKTKKKYKSKNSSKNKNFHGSEKKKYKELVQTYHQENGFVEVSFKEKENNQTQKSFYSNDEESFQNSSEYNEDESS